MEAKYAVFSGVLLITIVLSIGITKDYTLGLVSTVYITTWIKNDSHLGDMITPSLAFTKNDTKGKFGLNHGNNATIHDMKFEKPLNEPSNHIFDHSPLFNHSMKMSTWQQRRQDIISKRQQGDAIKIFLFAHMRGGSTLSGKIFESDPHAVMWYEPGDAFFSYYHGLHVENFPQNDLYFKNMTRRILDDKEKQALSDFYTNKFTCHYQDLPPEALAHLFLGLSSSFRPFKACMHANVKRSVSLAQCKNHISPICSAKLVETSLAHNCHKLISTTRYIMERNPSILDESVLTKLILKSLEGTYSATEDTILRFIKHQFCLNKLDAENNKCMSVGVKYCKDHSMQVVQVNRMKMEDLEPLIKDNPDVYVIHYIRDPRGIALSRMHTTLKWVSTGNSITKEAEFLCHRMAEDLRQRHILEQKYPGVFYQVRYEDIAAHPVDTVSNMYGFFQRDPPPKWQTFVERNMHALNAPNHNPQGTRVGDAVATALKWRTQMQKDDLQTIEGFCADYLRKMDYPLLFS